jgi:hypothetical protein
LSCGMQIPRSVFLNSIKHIPFVFFYESFFKYILTVIFLFLSSLSFQPYILTLCDFNNQIFLSVLSPSGVTNITNTSLSLTKLTHPAVLYVIFQTYYLQQICVHSIFPYNTFIDSLVFLLLTSDPHTFSPYIILP